MINRVACADYRPSVCQEDGSDGGDRSVGFSSIYDSINKTRYFSKNRCSLFQSVALAGIIVARGKG